MSNPYADRWAQSRQVMEALIARVEALSESQQHARPNAKEFTPCEMLEHMRRTEGLYPPLHESNKASGPAKPNFIYRMVLKRMQSGGRVGTMKELSPVEPINLQEVVEGWRALRADMERRTASAAPGQILLKHPLFGKMSAEDVINLLDAHAAYHQRFFPEV